MDIALAKRLVIVGADYYQLLPEQPSFLQNRPNVNRTVEEQSQSKQPVVRESELPQAAANSTSELDSEDTAKPGTRVSPVKLVLAFAAIYVIWGTTYLAMRIAVDTIPPFAIAGSRFLVAGFGLIVFLSNRGVKLPTFAQWKSAALIGCLLMIGGNGLVMWAIQEIPSGICAVVIATMPLWMTLFDWCFYKGPKPGWQVTFGLLLGLVGIVLLIGPSEILTGETTLHLPSMLAVICAPIFWSIGSLQSRQVDLPDNVFMSTAAQMICGGAVLLAMSALFGELAGIAWSEITWQSLSAVGYLAVFGSLIALTSYMWLLKNAAASRVATYSYINPVIAVFLGWLILSEPITPRTMVAILVIITAVVLIVSMRGKK